MEGEIILKISAMDFASQIYNIIVSGEGLEGVGNYLTSLSPEDYFELINQGYDAIKAALEAYQELAPIVEQILIMLGI